MFFLKCIEDRQHIVSANQPPTAVNKKRNQRRDLFSQAWREKGRRKETEIEVETDIESC